MDIGMDTRQIFIQRIGYRRAITRTLPALLTSLIIMTFKLLSYIIHILFPYTKSRQFITGSLT